MNELDLRDLSDSIVDKMVVQHGSQHDLIHDLIMSAGASKLLEQIKYYASYELEGMPEMSKSDHERDKINSMNLVKELAEILAKEIQPKIDEIQQEAA